MSDVKKTVAAVVKLPGAAPVSRLLDSAFASWVINNFAASLSDVDKELLHKLAQAVSHAVGIKHSCVDLAVANKLQDVLLDYLLTGITAADVLRILPNSVVQQQSSTTPLHPLICSAEGNRIWLHKYYTFECAMAAQLQLLRAQHRLEIITGGPGTGKTWTASQRIQQLLNENPDCVIALAAPTGKAANNMMLALANAGFSTEQHHLKGLTMHSLLGMTGRSPKPRRDKRHPLMCDVLIVDEASMIDLPMMHRLLQAIPDTATLLLLGDKDQLASVEAGSVLGDVCTVFSASCVTTLTESWRYKNSPEIGVLAQALNAGAVPDMKNNAYVKQHGLDASNSRQPGWLDSALAAFKRIPFDKNTTAIPDVLAAQKQFQILCALREGPQGVAGINSMIEQSLGKKAGSWYAGKPVMITSNDHARKLYNGDVGLVLPVSDDGQTIEWREGHTLKACFMVDGKVKAISIAQMPVYETCYAITIHKSQGSEYDHVLIVLPADVQAVHSNPVLSKELVYTAVTRAKTRVDIWCGEGVMQAAAAKTTLRMSGLSTLLSEHA